MTPIWMGIAPGPRETRVIAILSGIELALARRADARR
jgi:hypothetical protein